MTWFVLLMAALGSVCMAAFAFWLVGPLWDTLAWLTDSEVPQAAGNGEQTAPDRTGLADPFSRR